MSIINDHIELLRDGDHFHSAFDLNILQTRQNGIVRNSQLMAHHHGRQSVVNRKTSRYVDLRITVHYAACFKMHAQSAVFI